MSYIQLYREAKEAAEGDWERGAQGRGVTPGMLQGCCPPLSNQLWATLGRHESGDCPKAGVRNASPQTQRTLWPHQQDLSPVGKYR